MKPLGSPGQLFGVAQPPGLLLQSLLFPLPDLGVLDLGELKPKEVRPGLQFLHPGLFLRQLLFLLSQLCKGPPEMGRILGGPAKHVQNVPLGAGMEEALVLVLSMDVQEAGAQPSYGRCRGGGSVDPGPVSPLCRDLPPKEEETVLCGDANIR